MSQFAPLTWNADQRKDRNGSKTTRLHVGWINYLDSNNDWLGIDGNLKDEGAYFGADKLPFATQIPKYSDGQALFVADCRYDVHEKSKILEAPVEQEITAQGVHRVAGQLEQIDIGWGTMDAVRYPGAYDNADLIYYVHVGRAPRLRKVAHFPSGNNKELRLPYFFRYSDGVETTKDRDLLGKRVKTKGKIVNRKSGRRGVGQKAPMLWYFEDGQMKKIELEFDIEKTDGGILLTKIVPAHVGEFWCDTTSTIYPDDDEATTMDAEYDGIWFPSKTTQTHWEECLDLTSASYTGVTDNSQSYVQAQWTTSNSGTMYTRHFGATFDTSVVGTDTISALYGYLWASSSTDEENDTESYICMCPFSPADDNTIAKSDYANFTFNTQYSDERDITGHNTGSYETYTGNASAIAAVDGAGITAFGWMEGHCLERSVITTGAGNKTSRILHYHSEQTGTANDPYIEITHSGNKEVDVPAGSITLTGYAPTPAVSDNQTVSVPAGDLSFTGYAPTIAVSDNQAVNIPTADLSITGYAPTIAVSDHQVIAIPTADLSIAGYAPAVTIGTLINVPVANLTLTGYAPGVSASGFIPQMSLMGVG